MANACPSVVPCVPPRESEATTVTFAAFGDVENGTTALRDLIAAVAADPVPAFGVLLGDTVRRASGRRYGLLRRTIDRAAPPFPIVAVPGNRDRATDEDWYLREFGARTWAVRHGDVVFVGVDNAEGPLSAESLGTLARAPAGEHLVVFAHQPVHVAGETGPDAGVRAVRHRDLRAALGGRRIDAVVSGHLDLWQESRDAEGTLHVVNGHVPGQGAGTVPTAAVVTVVPGRTPAATVERVQVPARTDVLDAVQRLSVVIADKAVRFVADPLRRGRGDRDAQRAAAL